MCGVGLALLPWRDDMLESIEFLEEEQPERAYTKM